MAGAAARAKAIATSNTRSCASSAIQPVPVATTVHPVQIVGGLPRAPTDLPLAVIVTPDEVIRIATPPPAPAGIDWARLDAADLHAMPVLRELAERTGRG